MTTSPSKTELLRPILRELLAKHPHEIDATLAELASERLGLPVSKELVSRVKRGMGLGMYQQADRTMIGNLALTIAVVCFRNTVIEDYHAAGKLSGPEMKAFNKQVANRLYTVLDVLLNPELALERDEYVKALSYFFPDNWDRPALDLGFATETQKRWAED